ncbi:MAG: AMP-binding protein [Polyangiaceae bacterium]|nr:AMP-binding protein [Polyangiaceae bacterium]
MTDARDSSVKLKAAPPVGGTTTPLSLGRLFAGKRLVVVGGTGFLGKVWWSFLLAKFPEIDRIYLVVREKAGQSAQERFLSEIATSEVLAPLRTAHGSEFMSFLNSRVAVLGGDVVKPFCGISADMRDELRGNIDAVVNAAGVVDFDPPLDEGLEVNAFGVQNLVELARDLGNTALLHTSTCYVAGDRTGNIEEADPRDFPFPRAAELDPIHWDPDREIAECLDVVEQARHRAGDAFRQSHFLDEAKKNLREHGEPGRGKALEDEVQRVKRKFVEGQLSEMGMERARFWGFPNTYTYTKSIGEQIVARSGLNWTIVRPAIVESTCFYPFPGWNEGVNTSAPLIYILRQGGLQIPGANHSLDVIPCDMVAAGLTLALGELLEGQPKRVYQLGSGDTNPCTMRRFVELTGLYKRRYYQETGKGGPILSFLQAHYEGAMVSSKEFKSFGPLAIADGASHVSSLLDKTAFGPLRAFLKPASNSIKKFADQQRKVGKILQVFVPFAAEYDYTFRCANTREAYARLSDAEKELVPWAPETIDWREWFLTVHIPGLEKWVFPQIDKRLKRPKRPPRRHETLPALLDEMADRYDLAVALQRVEADGLSRLSFREWRQLSLACGARLKQLGVKAGDRVMIAAQNHPNWPISFFGVLALGATVVPLDANIEPGIAENLVQASGARILIGDPKSRARLLPLEQKVRLLDMHELCAAGPQVESAEVDPESIAALIYTSGTTGNPKGVQLSHINLTSLVASLAPLFPLSKGDRILSVLPLHHTFELTCGLLLPLSRGSRVVYLDELNGERLEHALKAGRITGLVGVPALWEMLERRISAKVLERGRVASYFFDVAAELNRSLGKNLGVDLGRTLFGPVHQGLGGHLRFLVSGGAALPEKTQQLFAGLGLHLAEGYGLTEASPVLTVSEGSPKTRAGHVGRAIPGVEIRIDNPNPEGIGEVVARGPNVMVGYTDEEATREVIDKDGWLHTGDLGKLDRRGNVVIVGRAKDTIVTSAGENIYPDDVEAQLGRVEHVKELAIVGVSDGSRVERVACVAVVEADPEVERPVRHARARALLNRAFAALPNAARPSVVALIDSDLPRTATRKVKRNEVRRLAESAAKPQNGAGSKSQAPSSSAALAVRSAVAVVARKSTEGIQPSQTLRGDLAFDSLMLLELLVALEAKVGTSLDADKLSECETVADVERLFLQAGARPRSSTEVVEKEEEVPLNIPPVLRDAAMHWMGRAQMGFYDRVLSTKVTGRAFIPHNKNTIVAANHASHLDMGLAKYGLGSYGQDLVSLAARDYFFEGNRWRKAYFENFTNLVAMDRSGSLRAALRQAGELLETGKTVLIFPEGTRSTDGQIHEFKPAVGYLSLHHNIDILPLYLGGTYEALPKGASVVRRRDVSVRIGPPLRVADLRRLTQGMSATEAARTVSALTRRAVAELERGRVLDISKLTPADLFDQGFQSLDKVFAELKGRFVPGVVNAPISYYFALGEKERWSLRVTPDSCEVASGKSSGQADCVLKTSPGIFTRIVREAYTPTPAEFMSGTVKSNNIQLLLTFQKLFQLESQSG